MTLPFPGPSLADGEEGPGIEVGCNVVFFSLLSAHMVGFFTAFIAIRVNRYFVKYVVLIAVRLRTPPKLC